MWGTERRVTGWVISSLMVLGLAGGAAAQPQVLVYDADTMAGHALTVATSLGYDVTHVTGPNTFGAAITQGPWDLVVLELPTLQSLNDDLAFLIVDYLQNGGRALLSFAHLDSNSSVGQLLREAFAVDQATDIVEPENIVPSDPAHPIWTTPNPLAFLEPTLNPFDDDGDILVPAAGAIAPANHDLPGGPAPAVVVQPGSIANGFVYDSFTFSEIAPFLENEMTFLLGPGGAPVFRRGDANSDSVFDISDVIFTLSALFSGGPAPTCQDAADSNDDETVDVSDAVYSLANLFSGGPPPPAPFPDCGEDPAGAGLDCADDPGC